MLEYHSNRHIPTLPIGKNTNIAPRQHNQQKNKKIRKPKEPPLTCRNNPRTKCGSKRNVIQTVRVSIDELSPIVKNSPISPKEAISTYGDYLTAYETNEILDFPEIYYVGIKNRKIEPSFSNKIGFSFDDFNHNYRFFAGDHLAYRYEILNRLGCGAFGNVLNCFDHKLKKRIAIKVIVSTDLMKEQGQVEANILLNLNTLKSKYIVKAFDYFVFRSHLCITFEVLGKSLYDILENNMFVPFKMNDIKNYAYEMLKGLEAFHKLGIVHCDLKPENILVHKDNKKHVKIIDFGSSCFVMQQKYSYIQSRFYRAPEVLLGLDYGPPMDMWSFGLILVELSTGDPLFPGDDELELITMISEILGPPDKELIRNGRRRREFFDNNLNLRESFYLKKRKPGSLTLQKALRTDNKLFCDFIEKFLTWDQNERMTASDALKHPWITSITKKAKIKKTDTKGLPTLKC